MKRFCYFMMAVILVLSLGVTAFADPTSTDGSITITNPTAGQTYRLYKFFNANYAVGDDNKVLTNAEGKAIVSYTIDTDNQFFAVMFGEDGTANNSYFNYNADTGVVTLKEDTIDEEVIKYLGTLVNSEGITPDDTVTAAADDETILFDGLDTGYYLIDRGSQSFVTLTTNTPDIEIIDKNQQPNAQDSFTKQVFDEATYAWTKETSANIGDIINFKITFEATNYTGDDMILYYVVRDDKDSALWVEFNDISVTVGNEELGLGYYYCAGESSLDTGDWTADKVPTQWAATPEEADWYLIHYTYDSFEIVIPWASECTFAGDENTASGYKLTFGDDAESLYASPSTVKVNYSASVGPDAANNTFENSTVENSATLQWFIANDIPDGPEDPQKTETTVYNLGITKTDAQENRLAGATFELYRDRSCRQPVYVIPTNNEGVYILDDFMTDITGANRTTSREKYANYLGDYDTAAGRNDMTTTNSGQLIIMGLKSGTYFLKETAAPAGYNQLDAPQEVVVGSGIKISEYDNDYTDLDGNAIIYDVYTVSVINNQGTELPSTGGTGTMLLITIGTVVALAFAVLLITHKKMSVYQD